MKNPKGKATGGPEYIEGDREDSGMGREGEKFSQEGPVDKEKDRGKENTEDSSQKNLEEEGQSKGDLRVEQNTNMVGIKNLDPGVGEAGNKERSGGEGEMGLPDMQSLEETNNMGLIIESSIFNCSPLREVSNDLEHYKGRRISPIKEKGTDYRRILGKRKKEEENYG
ncbi:hypothetical protein SUGI_1079870 [Cryptomeria japonica]|nr:hypothetical protein SUGI_1079870 [Cryptomeria japonica]